MTELQRRDGETNAEFATRLRKEAASVPDAWGGDDMRRELLARADRVERGEE
jgi:hypothetical protein